MARQHFVAAVLVIAVIAIAESAQAPHRIMTYAYEYYVPPTPPLPHVPPVGAPEWARQRLTQRTSMYTVVGVAGVDDTETLPPAWQLKPRFQGAGSGSKELSPNEHYAFTMPFFSVDNATVYMDSNGFISLLPAAPCKTYCNAQQNPTRRTADDPPRSSENEKRAEVEEAVAAKDEVKPSESISSPGFDAESTEQHQPRGMAAMASSSSAPSPFATPSVNTASPASTRARYLFNKTDDAFFFRAGSTGEVPDPNVPMIGLFVHDFDPTKSHYGSVYGYHSVHEEQGASSSSSPAFPTAPHSTSMRMRANVTSDSILVEWYRILTFNSRNTLPGPGLPGTDTEDALTGQAELFSNGTIVFRYAWLPFFPDPRSFQRNDEEEVAAPTSTTTSTSNAKPNDSERRTLEELEAKAPRQELQKEAKLQEKEIEEKKNAGEQPKRTVDEQAAGDQTIFGEGTDPFNRQSDSVSRSWRARKEATVGLTLSARQRVAIPTPPHGGRRESGTAVRFTPVHDPCSAFDGNCVGCLNAAFDSMASVGGASTSTSSDSAEWLQYLGRLPPDPDRFVLGAKVAPTTMKCAFCANTNICAAAPMAPDFCAAADRWRANTTSGGMAYATVTSCAARSEKAAPVADIVGTRRYFRSTAENRPMSNGDSSTTVPPTPPGAVDFDALSAYDTDIQYSSAAAAAAAASSHIQTVGRKVHTQAAQGEASDSSSESSAASSDGRNLSDFTAALNTAIAPVLFDVQEAATPVLIDLPFVMPFFTALPEPRLDRLVSSVVLGGNGAVFPTVGSSDQLVSVPYLRQGEESNDSVPALSSKKARLEKEEPVFKARKMFATAVRSGAATVAEKEAIDRAAKYAKDLTDMGKTATTSARPPLPSFAILPFGMRLMGPLIANHTGQARGPLERLKVPTRPISTACKTNNRKWRGAWAFDSNVTSMTTEQRWFRTVSDPGIFCFCTAAMTFNKTHCSPALVLQGKGWTPPKSVMSDKFGFRVSYKIILSQSGHIATYLTEQVTPAASHPRATTQTDSASTQKGTSAESEESKGPLLSASMQALPLSAVDLPATSPSLLRWFPTLAPSVVTGNLTSPTVDAAKSVGASAFSFSETSFHDNSGAPWAGPSFKDAGDQAAFTQSRDVGGGFLMTYPFTPAPHYEQPVSTHAAALTVGVGTVVTHSPVATCETTCGFGRGRCNYDTLKCECFTQFSGESCEQCAPGFWGRSCSKCMACEHGGSCDDGAAGTGQCRCQAPFSGLNCSVMCAASARVLHPDTVTTTTAKPPASPISSVGMSTLRLDDQQQQQDQLQHHQQDQESYRRMVDAAATTPAPDSKLTPSPPNPFGCIDCDPRGGYCECGRCVCITHLGWSGPTCSDWQDPCATFSLFGCATCLAMGDSRRALNLSGTDGTANAVADDALNNHAAVSSRNSPTAPPVFASGSMQQQQRDENVAMLSQRTVTALASVSKGSPSDPVPPWSPTYECAFCPSTFECMVSLDSMGLPPHGIPMLNHSSCPATPGSQASSSQQSASIALVRADDASTCPSLFKYTATTSSLNVTVLFVFGAFIIVIALIAAIVLALCCCRRIPPNKLIVEAIPGIANFVRPRREREILHMKTVRKSKLRKSHGKLLQGVPLKQMNLDDLYQLQVETNVKNARKDEDDVPLLSSSRSGGSAEDSEEDGSSRRRGAQSDVTSDRPPLAQNRYKLSSSSPRCDSDHDNDNDNDQNNHGEGLELFTPTSQNYQRQQQRQQRRALNAGNTNNDEELQFVSISPAVSPAVVPTPFLARQTSLDHVDEAARLPPGPPVLRLPGAQEADETPHANAGSPLAASPVIGTPIIGSPAGSPTSRDRRTSGGRGSFLLGDISPAFPTSPPPNIDTTRVPGSGGGRSGVSPSPVGANGDTASPRSGSRGSGSRGSASSPGLPSGRSTQSKSTDPNVTHNPQNSAAGAANHNQPSRPGDVTMPTEEEIAVARGIFQDHGLIDNGEPTPEHHPVDLALLSVPDEPLEVDSLEVDILPMAVAAHPPPQSIPGHRGSRSGFDDDAGLAYSAPGSDDEGSDMTPIPAGRRYTVPPAP